MFAKSQVIWNPLIYVLTNKNFRRKMPFIGAKAHKEGLKI
jgi:hypothetical protein